MVSLFTWTNSLCVLSLSFSLFSPFSHQELGDGSRELDNIIASSLQQLESARAFYEQMQARVKKD